MEVKVGRELVERLAWLSRLKLSESEIATLVDDFRRIIDFFNKIDELSSVLEGVEPLYHVLEVSSVVRPDKPRNPPSSIALDIAPESEGRFVKAPWRAR